jgi:hypothetical protein
MRRMWGAHCRRACLFAPKECSNAPQFREARQCGLVGIVALNGPFPSQEEVEKDARATLGIEEGAR